VHIKLFTFLVVLSVLFTICVSIIMLHNFGGNRSYLYIFVTNLVFTTKQELSTNIVGYTMFAIHNIHSVHSNLPQVVGVLCVCVCVWCYRSPSTVAHSSASFPSGKPLNVCRHQYSRCI
jgi:hypothetical protein